MLYQLSYTPAAAPPSTAVGLDWQGAWVAIVL